MRKYTFEWLKGSLDDNGIKILKEHNILFAYDTYNRLKAKIGGKWYFVQYVKVYGDTYDIVFCI